MRVAMVESGGEPGKVTGDNESRKLEFTGKVTHNTYENKLIVVANGKRTSWSFDWYDARVGNPAQ
ncbi:hypothetical protein [Pseudomonas frederiksbergensis]|nr:hypothetical protein [Pseudomonas frederiksbergensis]